LSHFAWKEIGTFAEAIVASYLSIAEREMLVI
jgi:hypothetical protein